MGLELRGNNFYYYEKERIGDKVRSVYAGKGDIALMLHWLKKDRKEQKKYELQRNNRENLKVLKVENEIESILDSFADVSKIFMDAFFLTNGFHQHKRQWRKKRNGKR